MAEDTQISARIRIGSSFQASVPARAAADAAIAFSGNDDERGGECIWDCERGNACDVEQYLRRLRAAKAHDSDDDISVERAIDLLRKCKYDANKAFNAALDEPELRVMTGAPEPWDAGECRLFEYAYMRYGSDFFAIADFMHPRSVAEVQQHYYTWKHGAEYSRFCARCIAECQAPSELDETDTGGDADVDGESLTLTSSTTISTTPAVQPTKSAGTATTTTTTPCCFSASTADICDFNNDDLPLGLGVADDDSCYCVDGSGVMVGSTAFCDNEGDVDDEAAAVTMSALASPLSPPPLKRQQCSTEPQQQQQQQPALAASTLPAFHFH